MRNELKILVACLVLVGFCGCHKSGTWENDPGNWKRAFGTLPPKQIQVLHSYYWRSPHFTREEEWIFHIKAPASFHEEWLAAYKVRHPDATELQSLNNLKTRNPSWFVPKPFSEYEIWVLAEGAVRNFAMFVDQTNGEFFVTDSQ